MVFTRGLLLQLALTIEEYTEDLCEKSSLLMSQHASSTGWLYRKSVFQGEVTIATKCSPTLLYLLPNALHGFLLPEIFLVDVTLFNNIGLLLYFYFPAFSFFMYG